MKGEYEVLLNNNIEQAKFLKQKTKNLKYENNRLKGILSKARNELQRLISLLSSDKEKMRKLKEEFFNRLLKEEQKRARLKNIIELNNKEILALQMKTTELSEFIRSDIKKSDNNPKIHTKNKAAKKDFEIEKLNEFATELELQICNLKKKKVKIEEESEKMKEILKYKESEEGKRKANIHNLFKIVEEEKNKRKKNKIILREKNNIIKDLRKENNCSNIIREQNLSKSSSHKNIGIMKELDI